ncbi:unnamed protein product [Alternaria alternata]
MPITAVLKIQNAGPLQQLQVGAADVVSTLAAAHSAWGWIGGMTGISNILSLCQRKHDLGRIREIFQHIEPEQGRCQILSQRGLITVSLTEDNNVFGDTPGSKLVGATLCALAHMMAPKSAIKIFQDFFLDRLFRSGFTEYPGSREALCTFLNDNYRSILNEGTVHQLNERFDEAISRLSLTRQCDASTYPEPKKRDPDYHDQSEILLIKGFFKWLFHKDDVSPYYTRSGTVARLATCLKYVGYQLTEIRAWNGIGKPPVLPRGLVLVTGGAFDTDRMMENESLRWQVDFVYHYHWQTIGAMLWNSIAGEISETFHEIFQQDFDNTYMLMKKSLVCIHWAQVQFQSEDIQAFTVWKDVASRPPSRIALRLASTLFPESADRIAPFYEEIANEKYLNIPKLYAQTKNNRFESNKSPASRELQRFKALTASICISILSQAAGEGFASLKHSTLLDLTQWTHLTALCTQVDAFIQGGCPMSRVITAIAMIHCAADIGQIFTGTDRPFLPTVDPEAASMSTVIGWRNGKYTVLPALLHSMERPLERAVLGLRCTDSFIANLPTQQDGTIRCPNGLSGVIMFDPDPSITAINHSLDSDPEKAQTAMETDKDVFFGRPSPANADEPLYISLERPSYAFGEPCVSLCGRVGGDSLGHVSIQDVLTTLAQSWSDSRGNDYKFCTPGTPHEDRGTDHVDLVPAHQVFNMAASRYCRKLERAPRDNANGEAKHNIYVQVNNDTPWAIFLAGQSPLHNRLTFHCIQCAVHTGDESSVAMRRGLTTLIGYR